MTLYNIFLHAHSGLRWLVFLFLVIAIVQALTAWQAKRLYPAQTLPSARLAFMLTNIQFLLGVVLYFLSPKVQFTGEVMSQPVFRFFTVEHIVGMIIAVALINIGFSRARKQAETVNGYRSIWVFYLLGLLLILLMIPWPWREELGGNWF